MSQWCTRGCVSSGVSHSSFWSLLPQLVTPLAILVGVDPMEDVRASLSKDFLPGQAIANKLIDCGILGDQVPSVDSVLLSKSMDSSGRLLLVDGIPKWVSHEQVRGTCEIETNASSKGTYQYGLWLMLSGLIELPDLEVPEFRLHGSIVLTKVEAHERLRVEAAQALEHFANDIEEHY